jgi:murein DD-endopeptidase MepM/ murein hydrolase activator NlpD
MAERVAIAGEMKKLRRVAFGVTVVWAGFAAQYELTPGPFPSPVEAIPGETIGPSFHAPRADRLHQGVDIFAPRGRHVKSIGWGIVMRIETQRLGGKIVFVQGRGGMLAFYAHLDDWAPGLHVGQTVEEGELLGFVGDTGNAKGTPPHLHFELRPAFTIFAPVDPLLFLAKDSTAQSRALAAVRSLPEPR